MSELLRRVGDFLHRGVAHIFHLVIVLAEKCRFERQNGEKARNVTLNLLHAILLPHPHLGRYEIEARNALIVSEFRNFQVKRRIVDKNHGIGPIVHYRLLSRGHKAQNGGQMLQYLHKPHVCHIAVMDKRPHASGLSHHIAAEKLKLRFGIFLPECTNQACAVYVATCLTCYDKIFCH